MSPHVELSYEQLDEDAITGSTSEAVPDPTAFPWRAVLVIASASVTEGLVNSSLFPMVPYLIRDCGVPENEGMA